MSHNIIIIAPIPSFPANDGYSYGFMNRIEFFYKKNYKIHFFASVSSIISKKSNFSELEKKCEKMYVYTYDKPKELLKHGKIKSLLNIITKFWLPSTVSMRFSVKMKKNIFYCINKHKIEMIFVEYPYLLINVPSNIITPIVLFQHNLEFNKIMKRAMYVNFIKKILMLHEGQKLKKYEYNNTQKKIVSLYTFVSTENKEVFENVFCVKNTYLFPPGYSSCIRYQSVYKKGKIVFVGAMNDLQNINAIEWFVDKVFPVITQKFEDVKLYVIGKNPTKKILQLNSENIIVTGMVDSVEEYIIDAHLYIIPLLFGDGVKIKTLEAFASGNIVVSTSIGVEGLDFVSGRDYILADTKDEFIEKCNFVLDNRENYEYLAINATEKMQELYSWDSILNSYENKIKSLIKINKDRY